MISFYELLFIFLFVPIFSFTNETHFVEKSFQIEIDQLTLKMKELKKSEQHLHLGGAWPLNFLKEISTPKQFSDLMSILNTIENGVNYHDVFPIFQLINQIMNSEERIQKGVVALCTELREDHVIYAEFRTGLKDLGSGLKGYLDAILKGIQIGTLGTSLKIGLILSVRRDTPSNLARETIDLAIEYRDKGIVGIDVSGDSTIGDGKTILPELIRAKTDGLPITLHLGESKEEKAEQQMMELTLLQPKRIGHGVHLCKEAREWIKSHHVLVELCLTSALKSGMLDRASEHPALKLMLEGHPVSICTDDPLIFNTTLSQEYAKVAFLTGLTPSELEEIQEKTINYHFLRDH